MKKQPIYNPDDELLRKYLQGELNIDESEALKIKLDSDPAAREHFHQMEKIWKLSEGMKDYQSIDTSKDWSDWKKKLPAKETTTVSEVSDDVSVNDVSMNMNISPGEPKAINIRFLRIAAAIVLVAISASLIYYYTGTRTLGEMDWITFSSVEPGEELILPDGSVVWLNSGSSLEYPVKFRKKNRAVRLEGEGFFEVVHNENKPFIVLTGDETSGDEAVVEVLGTSFNLRTDPESRKIFLHVSEGRVAFYPKGKRKKGSVLEREEQADYEKGRITQRTSIDLNFLSWKTRTLEFESTPLSDVVDQLGRHYQKDIRVTGKGLDTLTLTGTYIEQSMQEVLEEISIVLDIEFNDVDGIIRVN